MQTTVLSGAARAVVLELQARGRDPAPFLEEAGLTLDEVLDPDRRIAAGKTERLWEAARAHVGDPLEMAARLPLGAYRLLDFFAAHSETVGDGLRRIAASFAIVDPRVRLTVDDAAVHDAPARRSWPHAQRPDDDERSLVMTSAIGGALPPLAEVFTLGATLVRHRTISGVSWPLLRVELTAAADAVDATLVRSFDAPVVFGAPRARLVLTRAAFEMRVPRAEPQLLPLLEEHARLTAAPLSRLPTPIEGFADALQAACADGRPTITEVARRMRTPPRTLQRRLDDAGTTFSQLVDRLREGWAREHLVDRTLAIAEIAFLLGFSDQAAFTKAFSRWTGTTPHAFRRSAWRSAG